MKISNILNGNKSKVLSEVPVMIKKIVVI